VSNARIEALGAGRFRVSGVLNAVTVIDLLKQSRRHFAGITRIDIDLSAVPESDSAGLALLLEWLRAARLANQQIKLSNMPAQISALARISEVDDLLAASGDSPVEKPQVADPTGASAPKIQTA
jgi:phospholipid transport system transporter-binding protein